MQQPSSSLSIVLSTLFLVTLHKVAFGLSLSLPCLHQQTERTTSGLYAGIIFPLLLRHATSTTVSDFISLLNCAFSSAVWSTSLLLTEAREVLRMLSERPPVHALNALRTFLNKAKCEVD